ncbi:tetratricopeptide repeat protein [Bacteroides xylanisolvens]|uniref:Tetratricopeptide repeat protein n=2 Tax=Bacteroides xylanisolvens TaxID=371601 RepID=A0A6A2RUI4_9BACE|nr:serine protease [Bacteroides xylanisolvens]KAB6100233.1 tetratricopeptide repeat protein [Bacteroides xylanisolvens]KAB6102737.1 tetratricopeptide repeat protein [Bacteroides xylanisolvens]KAB6120499.1 tetratricopeptide repeat protein [Bacteroides xylanisolvens]KAB6125452.1 tetratricopeptide repeat protein [Bacteroides xylanisolvens]KAB6131193.1 tetratricopeptide repeat protein [Bacteroides xylanisolvens]
MKKILILPFLLFFLIQGSMAQTPKWVEKAKRAVFSVVTYDKNDKMLNTGNGFFVSEDGLALSDYTLFKGAERAVVITSEGKQMPVSLILGANDMYDVIKFRVAITEKKVPALIVAKTAPAVGADAWMLPYSTQKSIACVTGKVKEVSKVAGEYHYYTLGMQMKDKMVSCPVMNAEGQVFGIAQKSSGIDTVTTCYAAGAAFAMAQKISALSLGDAALKKIGIRKGLPETEDQALVYLFMASSSLSGDDYEKLLDDFIRQFPANADGYLRRANYYAAKGKDDQAWYDKAVADFNQALKVAQKKDDVYYNIGKLIYAYQLSKPEKTYKDWTYDTALQNVRQAIAIDPLPIYIQMEGDILFAQQDYAGALAAYEKVNASNIASPATFFSAAKTKELAKGDPKEVVALMDSCIARCPQPITADFAPYLLERAQMNMNAGQPRNAMLDYDAYHTAVKGEVNDVFYYYREQAALKARQFQRALDDIVKAIEMNPTDLTYQAEHAVVNLRVGRYEEAIQILNNILKADPKYAEAYRLLGLCQIQLKKTDEACGNFKKAKELGDPNVDELITKYCK